MESIPHDTRLAGPEITDGAALYGVCECGTIERAKESL
jgi:hypothetical protein